MQQAARISDKTAFFLLGEIIEYNDTTELFSRPQNKKTEEYITGGLVDMRDVYAAKLLGTQMRSWKWEICAGQAIMKTLSASGKRGGP